MPTREEIDAAIEAVSKSLVDAGKLVEAGFAAYLAVVWGPNALDTMPVEQLAALKKCYFCGAQHLWGTVMNVMDPGDEPSETDLKRMDLINDELLAWHKTMVRDHYPVKGSG